MVAFPGLEKTLSPVATSLVHLSGQVWMLPSRLYYSLLSLKAAQLTSLLRLFLSFAAVEELRGIGVSAFLKADPVQVG